mgnify:CR=1 FL=1
MKNKYSYYKSRFESNEILMDEVDDSGITIIIHAVNEYLEL